MKKKVFGRKLSRNRPAREALFASLMRSLILTGKMETTKAKAKAVQAEVERFVNLAKKADIAGRRRILSRLDNARDAVDAMYKKVAPAFSVKNSGFTRMILLPTRKGDNAQMVRLEWTEKLVEEKPKKEKAEVKAKIKTKKK